MLIIAVFPSLKEYPERLKELICISRDKNVQKVILFTRLLPVKIEKFELNNKKFEIRLVKGKISFYLGMNNKIRKLIGKNMDIVILNYFLNFIFGLRRTKKHNILKITKIFFPNIKFLLEKNYLERTGNIRAKFNKSIRLFLLYLKRSLYDLISIYNSDIIISNSNEIKSSLENFKIFKNKVFSVLSSSVDTEYFVPLKRNKNNKYFKIFFAAGTIQGRKGILDLIIVVNELKKTSEKIRTTIAGSLSTKYHLSFLDKIKELGLEENIEFSGRLDKKDLVKFYQNSDIFIFPSYYEGSPRVIKEAMSCGLPVICYDIDGTRLIDPEGKVIQFVKKGDVSELKRVSGSLIGNTERRKQLSESGRYLVIDNFSIKKISKMHVAIFSKYLQINKLKDF